MIDLLTSGLVLPALILAVLGWAVPKALSRVWPEGVQPLILLAVVSAVVLLILSMLGFAALYGLQGAPVGRFFDRGVGPGLWHFARLGLMSALVWGPILVLSVANLPRHWTREVW